MGDLTLTDRVMVLEDSVRELRVTLQERLASVVLVEKRKPGPAKKSKEEKKLKSEAFRKRAVARTRAYRARKRLEKVVDA